MGASSCLLYNIHVASSITSMARSSISATICFFEMFLNDNVKFRSLNEVITFIYNVTSEKYNRNYNDKIILDRDITKVECLAKIAKGCQAEDLVWIPDEKDVEIIWEILCNLDQEDINRIYYKNNLFSFMNNTIPTKSIIKLLDTLKTPFLNPNKPPKEIKEDLLIFEDMLKEYVYYSYQIIDRIERNINMTKSVTIISDTDSAIVNLDGWYRFILDKIEGRKMNIAYTLTDCIKLYEYDEFGDRVHPGTLKEYYPYEPIIIKTPDLDYDFYNDEIIEMKRSINPIKLIPQDGVRYSIINIISYCLTDLANDYMNRYCDLNNSNKNNPSKCRLFLKNEFLFKSVLMTMVKKHYATIHELQEGHNVGNTLDIKGLDMDKTTLNPRVKEEMQKIMYEDILNIDKIDQVNIMKKIAILEKSIFQSLQSGSKEFYKPLQVKPMNKYENPMSIQGIRCSVIWNAIKDDDLISLNLEERNAVDIVKVNINLSTIEKIKDLYPDTYDKIYNLLKDNIYKGQINALAIPRTVNTIPKWVIEFIDYNTIANNNLSTFPFEDIGLTRMAAVKNNNVNYSNILTL